MGSAQAIVIPVLLATFALPSAGQGGAVVNAPITPDTIYLGRVSPRTGLSVVDLNGFGSGFGSGSGSPRFDPMGILFEEGWTQYPYNPNVSFQGGLLRPPLQPGTTNVDGGSPGVFNLTRDSKLSKVLTDTARVRSVADMMLGPSLDSVFHNSFDPDGCQVGGGNLCASTALKLLDVTLCGPNTLKPREPGEPQMHVVVGAENPISFAPHPNPPPLLAPAPCDVPLIGGEEPTSVDVLGLGSSNLLVPGDPMGDPANGIPPSGLLTLEQNSYFNGPSLPAAQIGQCSAHTFRRQVGHFLYVADPAAGRVRVLDSNQMRLLDEIQVEDPTQLAMDPNLDLLAVTSRATDTVIFIDIDPHSTTFHQVVQVVQVGDAPCGVAWDPANEDVLVCNEGDNSLSILSVSSLSVRKTLTRTLNKPFDVVITPRRDRFGFGRDVYFAYILNRDGTLSVFESGPDGINGWGYDDVLGRVPFVFQRPTAIQPDTIDLRSGVWITHEGSIDPRTGESGPLGQGAVSQLVLAGATFGPLPLIPGTEPQFRDMSYAVPVSLGQDELSGLPVDLAFDDQRNFGALPNLHDPFSAGTPFPVNGKGTVRFVGGQVVNTNEPQLLFIASRGTGGASTEVVDVIDLSTYRRLDTNPWLPGIDSIRAPGVRMLMSYFRQ